MSSHTDIYVPPYPPIGYQDSKVLSVIKTVQLESGHFLERRDLNSHVGKGSWKALRTLETVAVDYIEHIFNSDTLGHYEARLILVIDNILSLFGL